MAWYSFVASDSEKLGVAQAAEELATDKGLCSSKSNLGGTEVTVVSGSSSSAVTGAAAKLFSEPASVAGRTRVDKDC